MSTCYFPDGVLDNNHFLKNLSRRRNRVRKGILVDRSLKEEYSRLLSLYYEQQKVSQDQRRQKGHVWHTSISKEFEQAKEDLQDRKRAENKPYLHEIPALATLKNGRYKMDDNDPKILNNHGLYQRLLPVEDLIAEANRWKSTMEKGKATYEKFCEHVYAEFNFPTEILQYARIDHRVPTPKKKNKKRKAAPAESSSPEDSLHFLPSVDDRGNTERSTENAASQIRNSTVLQGQGLQMQSPSITYSTGMSAADVTALVDHQVRLANAPLAVKVEKLQRENALMREALRKHGIEVPGCSPQIGGENARSELGEEVPRQRHDAPESMTPLSINESPSLFNSPSSFNVSEFLRTPDKL